MFQAVAQTHFDECVDGALAALLGLDLGIIHQRELDVFDGCGLGEEVVVLEDESDLAVAQLGTLVAAHPTHRHAIEIVFARRGGIEASNLVEQGGFARARSPLDGHEFTFVDLERHSPERMYHLVADLKVAANVFELDDGFSFIFAHMVGV